MKLKDAPWKKNYDQPRQHSKRQKHYFSNKCLSSQSYSFSSSHTWMRELDYKESWVLNNWCFWTVVLEETLESPFNCKEIQPVHTNWNQSWIFIWWTDAKVEAPILWPPDAESTHWKRTWCWERLKARKGNNRGWNVWMASLTQRTWAWAISGSWWWTLKPGMLQSVRVQRVVHDWVTDLNWNKIQYMWLEFQINNGFCSRCEILN